MSKRLKELRQRQHDLKAEGNALLDAADTDKRELTEAEEKRFGEIEAEVKTLETQITAEERNQERRRSLESTTRVPARHITSTEPNPHGPAPEVSVLTGVPDSANLTRTPRTSTF